MDYHGELRERLAALEHEQWMQWSKSLASETDLPSAILERWQAQWKPYELLTEEMKDLDRAWVEKVLGIFTLWV